MSNRDTSQISQLLGGTVDALDLPPELHAAAERQYQAVGQFLAEQTDAGGEGWDVSPQGSFLLGTVTPAIVPGDQFDLDMVCRRNIDKTATTQSKLKAEVGALLNYYVRANKEQPGAPSGCHERRRCWTLEYPVAFHMDVLPAIPNPDGSPTGIMLTDKTLRFWQFSDPAAYANWFKARIDEEIQRQRGLVAAALAKSIEEVPEWAVKATLQRVVQVLKRHRDLYFAKDLDNRPPSILITTLAARAYQGDDDLFAAVLQTTTDMPAFIERAHGIWLVMNPVADENFADKWSEHPERPRLFKEWLDKLTVDLEDAQGRPGIDQKVARLIEGFGAEPVRKAAIALGKDFRRLGDAGALTMAAGTGIISTRPGHTIPKHGFYGATET